MNIVSSSSLRLPLGYQVLQKDHSNASLAFNYIKRGIDITFSLFAIIICYPICMPILALWIKLDSTGPVFFVQKGVGYQGKQLSCDKFRTMGHQGKEERITKAGSVLRNTGLDEIPQFLNVLKGDMSIVGPRPYSLSDHVQFSEEVPCFHRRYQVKPGITGLSQVHGYKGKIYNVEALKQRSAIDLIYIQDQSLRMELRIIYLTIKLVCKEIWTALWNK